MIPPLRQQYGCRNGGMAGVFSFICGTILLNGYFNYFINSRKSSERIRIRHSLDGITFAQRCSCQVELGNTRSRILIDSGSVIKLVFADISLTERVLQNLLDNAFKFTPHGGTIEVHLTAKEKGIEVAVSDTGIGIKPEDQLHVFQRYKQLSNKTDSSTGMGIVTASRSYQQPGN